MPPIISITNLSKTYATGFRALKEINLDIKQGEIFALLGPNGAGKTTLIGIVCGILVPTGGKVTVGGHDILKRLPRDALDDRAGAAGDHDGAVRNRLGGDHDVARAVQQAEEPRLSRKSA